MGLLGTKSDNKVLFKAIEERDIETVKKFLTKENNFTFDINKVNKEGNYPLLIAIKKNYPEIVQLIIDYANRNISLLFDYAERQNTYINFELKDNFKNYPLLYAAKNNNIEMVKLFIDYAEENSIILFIDDPNEFEETPLVISIKQRNPEIASLIISYCKRHNIKLDVSSNNKNGLYEDIFYGGTLFGLAGALVDDRKYFKKQKDQKKEKQKQIDSINYLKSQNKLEGKTNSTSTSSLSKIEQEEIKNSDLAIVNYEFNSTNPKELSLKKGEQVYVLHWYIRDGWSYGFKKNNPQERGRFPRFIVNKYLQDNAKGDLVSALYDFKGNKSEELDFKKGDYLRVLDWEVRSGWVYGYNYNNSQKKGIFPLVLIRKALNLNDEQPPSYEDILH
ncbi:hypothetical protein PIROE2DRAFT_7153 [Piromyces sp. E2]|nr:hypothetical protein PIROE2DRAFT_7153 [Piromyces sp. E2]|eukprot:OUM65739.1 hypothetical protein PIROE2DRAFT_7153 [Piromyces sp. E2]